MQIPHSGSGIFVGNQDAEHISEMDHGVVHVYGHQVPEEVNYASYHVREVEGASPAHFVARTCGALHKRAEDRRQLTVLVESLVVACK